MINVYNTYANLSAEQKAQYLDDCYIDTMINMFMEMWEFTNWPEKIDKKVYFQNKLLSGKVGWCEYNGELAIGSVNATGGQLDIYGYLPKLKVIFANGKSVDGIRDKDIVVGYLNSTHSPDMNMMRFAEMLKETDISMRLLIEKTRLMPIPVFKDQKIKDQIMKDLDKIKIGDTQFYNYNLSMEEIFQQSGQRFDLLNLTDVKDVDKIMYLCSFHDDLMSRYYSMMGMRFTNDVKMAQQTNDELNGYRDFAQVYPLVMLHEFESELEKVNKIFGEDIQVTFAKPWKWILEEVKDYGEETNTDY